MKVKFTCENRSKTKLYEKNFEKFTNNTKIFGANDVLIKNKYKIGVDFDGNVMPIDNDLISVCVSEALYIEGLPLDKQPGENFRKIKVLDENGNLTSREMNDEETISYYSKIVSNLGGRANAKIVDTVIVKRDGKEIKNFKIENDTTLTSVPSKITSKGNPMHSLMLVPEFGDIYYSECGEDEKNFLMELKGNKMYRNIEKTFKNIKG